MMATCEFYTFAAEGSVGSGDLLPLDAYADDGERATGFQRGLARRALINRALRQSSHMGAVLARFVADTLDVDVHDDADVQALADQFGASVARFAATVAQGDKGDPGAAATLEIVEVVKIAPGAQPEIVNLGDAHAAKLVIKIPQGYPGIQGPPGDSNGLKPGHQFFLAQV